MGCSFPHCNHITLPIKMLHQKFTPVSNSNSNYSCRARAWLHLCGAQYKLDNSEHVDTWKKLVSTRGESRYTDDIEKDLHRNFPTHELFGGEYEKIGRAELYTVLKAYSLHNPSDGYCQAQVNSRLMKEKFHIAEQ